MTGLIVFGMSQNGWRTPSNRSASLLIVAGDTDVAVGAGGVVLER